MSNETTTTNILQVKVCLIGLELENKTGLKVSRISARDCAKRILGYKPTQRPTNEVLINQLKELLTEAQKMIEENRETGQISVSG
jgi:hypothetical protein